MAGKSKQSAGAVIACAAQSTRGVGYAAFEAFPNPLSCVGSEDLGEVVFYAARYAEALQLLGFAFLHPLKVIAPKVISLHMHRPTPR
eukprot:4876370-Amphidinium_carterae.1